MDKTMLVLGAAAVAGGFYLWKRNQVSGVIPASTQPLYTSGGVLDTSWPVMSTPVGPPRPTSTTPTLVRATPSAPSINMSAMPSTRTRLAGLGGLRGAADASQCPAGSTYVPYKCQGCGGNCYDANGRAVMPSSFGNQNAQAITGAVTNLVQQVIAASNQGYSGQTLQPVQGAVVEPPVQQPGFFDGQVFGIDKKLFYGGVAVAALVLLK